MFTTTHDLMFPTTVTGSWPRPRWFDRSLWGRSLSDAMTDVEYREKFLDAVAAVISDQEQAGLDILTNGDYHLDENLGPGSVSRAPVDPNVRYLEVKHSPSGSRLAQFRAKQPPPTADRSFRSLRFPHSTLDSAGQGRQRAS